jgi:hypothetical protein
MRLPGLRSRPVAQLFNRGRRRAEVRGQPCWLHKTADALNHLPKRQQSAAKNWHRLLGQNHWPKVIPAVKFTDGIEVLRSQAQAAAA